MMRVNFFRRAGFEDGPVFPGGRRGTVVHHAGDGCSDCDTARRRGIGSLCTFPPDDAERIRYLREQPKPPEKWLLFGDKHTVFAAIESRAWLEWRRYHRPEHVPGSAVPAAMRDAAIERDGYFCGICRQVIEDDEEIDIDHIVPFSKGGATVLKNLRVTHMRCNRHRGNRLEDVYDVKTGRWLDSSDVGVVAGVVPDNAEGTEKQDVSGGINHRTLRGKGG